MKKIILPVVMYILLYVLSLLLLTTAVFIYRMVVDYSPVFLSLGIFLAELPGTLKQVLPTATAAALILVLLLRVRSRGRNLTGSVLVILFATALYAFPFLFLDRMQPENPGNFDFPFFEKKLTQIENTIVYVGEAGVYEQEMPAPREGDRIPLEGLALLHMNGSFPKINYYRHSTADPKDGILRSAKTDGQAEVVLMDYGARKSLSGEFVAAPGFLKSMFLQISELTAALDRNLGEGLFSFFLTTLSQVLFLVGAWSLIRSSRWPLWNGILALVFFRGFFYLDSLFRSDVVLEAMKMLTIEKYNDYAAPAAFILLFILFTMWGFFFTKSEADLEAGA